MIVASLASIDDGDHKANEDAAQQIVSNMTAEGASTEDIDLKIIIFKVNEEDEIYFFLVDNNNMDSVLHERYRVN